MSTQSICGICGANYEYLNGRWRCPACGAYKAEELSIKRLTRNNPTMAAKFAELENTDNM